MRDGASLELGPIHLPMTILPLFSEYIPGFLGGHPRRQAADDDLGAFLRVLGLGSLARFGGRASVALRRPVGALT